MVTELIMSTTNSLFQLHKVIIKKIKQCFQRKTMSPQPQIESASMLTALYHNDTG